ncbi:DNA alkylation repair protein [Streptomyces sp. SCSIO 30461]|uniref:DNA alkylation repair protein n=1 Tax=Streptomyces sp. SCSIO 30461 TaxID=3118085 RepID=UPI00387ED7F4
MTLPPVPDSPLADTVLERLMTVYAAAADPALVPVMDEWIEDDNLWIVRTALLHQLRYKDATDRERLFRYCLRQSDHPDFFIRKAIGWSLREYAKTDPDAVRAFVAGARDRLAPLSVREALKNI